MSIETMTKLASTTVGVGGSASIVFSNIPQNYTDLVLKLSSRDTSANAGLTVWANFNGNTTSTHTFVRIFGSGSAAGSSGDAVQTRLFVGDHPGATATASTFGNIEMYIPNYAGNTFKSISNDTVQERAATEAYQNLSATLWSNSSPINQISLTCHVAFAEFSTATLYGVKDAQRTAGNSLKATGGDVIFDGTYVYHVFDSTGAFVPTQSLLADVLVVAGGGGGGSRWGGGGGAGGLLGFSNQSFVGGNSVVCTIGAGGAGGGGASTGGPGSSGGNSQFGTLTAAVGGGWGINWISAQARGAAGTGGSGGGATSTANGTTSSAGSGTVGQGNNGGGSGEHSGGGGGAGGVGSTSMGGGSGSGGVGSSAYSSWGAATGVGQNVNGTFYLAGGGGGGTASASFVGGVGGWGGGGNGNNGSTTNTPAGNGQPATGGGGGGAGNNGDSSSVYGGAGGSGIVIVRYKG
jgi:hypothetical protein